MRQPGILLIKIPTDEDSMPMIPTGATGLGEHESDLESALDRPQQLYMQLKGQPAHFKSPRQAQLSSCSRTAAGGRNRDRFLIENLQEARPNMEILDQFTRPGVNYALVLKEETVACQRALKFAQYNLVREVRGRLEGKSSRWNEVGA